jgi:secretion/DNA translocation related CpaE-like protein
MAAAISLTAAAGAPALLMDLDPLGPAAARVVGLDDVSGAGWEALAESPGRFGSRSLRAALPAKEGLAVLTWRGVPAGGLEPSSVREALAAARRGNRTVVLDLPRHLGPAALEAVARCDEVLVVCGRTVTGVAAACRLTVQLRDIARSLRLAVRGSPSAMATTDLERVLGVPAVVEVPDQKRLDEHISLGLGPVYARRGPLARAARQVLDRQTTDWAR